jgi:hypothetical protein
MAGCPRLALAASRGRTAGGRRRANTDRTGTDARKMMVARLRVNGPTFGRCAHHRWHDRAIVVVLTGQTCSARTNRD